MICPFAVWRPVPSHSGAMSAHQGLVLHVQVGNGSCYGEFLNRANQASSTWWVSKAGLLEQYVDSDLAAWTEAAGNYTWDSVETEGVPGEALTAAQITTLARLYAWGVAQYAWPLTLAETPAQRGFGWHGMGGSAWGGHTGCPGDLRKAQRQQILTLAAGPIAPTTPAAPTTLTGELMSRLAYDEKTGGNWAILPNGAVFSSDGAPYLGGLNAHPSWNAGTVSNPAVGIVPWKGDGTDKGGNGYIIVTLWGADTTGDPFRYYRFPRVGVPASA